MSETIIKILQSLVSSGTEAENATLTRPTSFDGDIDEAIRLALLLEAVIDAVPIAVGLAAPQIGVSQRVAVVKLADQAIHLIDPTVVDATGKRDKKRESCLSVWGYAGEVERREKVLVRYLDPQAGYVERSFRSFEARAVQHEVDHLDGVLYLSHVRGGLVSTPLFDGHTPSVALKEL